ncbi:hypothetical protein [Castellaniella sp.]|uniref:hypothetical protein n=1 Tax=Castellaniella sp. TaxID=1955812 RepID=UPI002AFE5D69|nr:hypothetical protein [Castellaniella sp.]
MSDRIIEMPSEAAMISLAASLRARVAIYYVADSARKAEVEALLPNQFVAVFESSRLRAFTAKYIFMERVVDPWEGREGDLAELAAMRTATYPGGLVFVLR